MIYSSKKTRVKVLLTLVILIVIINIKSTIYATIRGDADSDNEITAYDAYVIMLF